MRAPARRRRDSRPRKTTLFGALATFAVAACGSDAPGGPGGSAPPCASPEAPLAVPKLHTPRWAFEPWISKDISDTADTYAFIDGFRSRDIPVGVVVLDSPWETHYNTFVPSPTRYPDFGKLVRDMHDRGVRVVLWTTQMVNTSGLDLEPGGDRYEGPAASHAEGVRCGYYLDDGEEYFWWKGNGSAVDLFNPAARAWWHKQQDTVLDLGVDGWKLDFGESYIRKPTVKTAAGVKPLQQYSEKYYEDFLAYGVAKRGRDFTTMVRAWDESYDHPGRFFARPEHAPVAWMGDNRRDFIGLADALDHMFVSARAGYGVVGSDVGGYLDLDDKNLAGPKIPFSLDVFLRWTAVGAMGPFMQLHGRANLAPWTVPERADESVRVYRAWSKLHRALAPFFYGAAEAQYAGKGKVLEPVGDAAAWKGDYRYVLGGALLVAPILDASGVRDVPLPAGARWYDWFDPGAAPIDGGTTVRAYDARDFARAPVFVRQGAIVPVTGDGSGVVVVWPDAQPSSFTVPDDDPAPLTVGARAVGASDELATRSPAALTLRVRTDGAATDVLVDGASLGVQAASRDALGAAARGWVDERAGRATWVKVEPGTHAVVVRR
jgi:alpha-D-xyloside xylohydrolase